ncbi:hypothetical protein H5202_18410 [Shewanella sp. SG41-4]|uniref:hypothetical protein n=1 Tax=Shewanella TaxID=22 RepID=UPI00140532DC|nr:MULTISPECIES: hypothetical protein [Shewanella]MBB1440610.1 hypothetical protein [Shewanella sp. SG41-4]
MTGIYRLLLLVTLIVLALTCYLAGSQTGAITFFVAGGLLESAFWFGLFKKNKNRVVS